MILSIYSTIMGMVWFSVFIILAAALRRRKNFMATLGFAPVMLIIALGIFRLLLSFEFPFTNVVTNTTWLPTVQDFFTMRVSSNSNITVATLTCVIWAAGAVVSLWIIFRKELRYAKRARKMPVHHDEDITYMLNTVLAEKKPDTIAVKTDSLAKSPYIAGYFRPTIYLPNSDFNTDELLDIFQHETRHYIFHDLWIKLIIQVLCAIFWWNPLVYLLKYDLDYMLETKCDIDIIENKTKDERKRYSLSIANVAASTTGVELPEGQMYSLRFVNRKSEKKLQQRLDLVLNYSPNRKRIRRNSILTCLCAVVVTAASYMVILQPGYYVTAEDYTVPEGFFTISEDNSYLKDNMDGTYSLFSDGEYRCLIDEGSLEIEPYNSLPVR